MKVAVCDDNIIFLEEIRRELQMNQGIDTVYTYSEIDRFFQDISEGEKYDVIFLDIDWGEVKTTGLEFGEKLYKLLPQIPIILMTGYNDRFAQQILLKEMNLVGYLTKPIDSSVVTRYLSKVKDRKIQANHINLTSQGMVVRLVTNEIIHVESHNHQSHVHTKNDRYVVYEKISDILKRLPEEFVQCHKSFLVNLEYVSALDGKEVVMKDGKRIAISRTYYNSMKDKFFTYIGKMI